MTDLTRRGFIILGAAALAGCTAVGPIGSTSPAQLTIETMTAQINATRRANGREPMTYNATLAQAARVQANLMASKDQLSHDLGKTLRERVNEAGGYPGAIGENVGGGYATLEGVIRGWLDSASHKSTLLNPKFTEFGLAVARVPSGRKSKYGIYWSFVAGGDLRLWMVG